MLTGLNLVVVVIGGCLVSSINRCCCSSQTAHQLQVWYGSLGLWQIVSTNRLLLVVSNQ